MTDIIDHYHADVSTVDADHNGVKDVNDARAILQELVDAWGNEENDEEPQRFMDALKAARYYLAQSLPEAAP